MRIAMFGGSFDPIHLGHLILAEHCREQAQLDEVWFIPSATAPNKRDGARATDRQRLEMLRLAIGGHPHFKVSEIEIQRGGVSYTVDTLAEIQTQQPEAKLFLLMGADSLVQFKNWREPERILGLAHLLVVERPGQTAVANSEFITSEFIASELITSEQGEPPATRIESPLIEISSTRIRERSAEGKSTRFLTPRAVEKYIETQKVYRTVD